MKKIIAICVLSLFLAGCTSWSYGSGQSQLTPKTTPSGGGTSLTPKTSSVTPGSVTHAGKGGVPNFDHIVLIMLENRDYQTMMDSNQMPLFDALARKNVLLSNYFAVAHPSLPNYIALISGDTQNITNDCTDCFINQPNLADLIEASGRSWKAYLEGMPSPCFVGNSGDYAQKHNPLLYFDSIRLNAARCEHGIVPLTSLDGDLTNKQLPNFSYIMPDLCNSGHNCSAATADKWVSKLVARLQASTALESNSLIIIAFDEGDAKSKGSCCGLPKTAGGQVAVVLISPFATPGFTDNTPYSHYSLLKTILTAWNLPALGQTAQDAIQPIEAPWIKNP